MHAGGELTIVTNVCYNRRYRGRFIWTIVDTAPTIVPFINNVRIICARSQRRLECWYIVINTKVKYGHHGNAPVNKTTTLTDSTYLPANVASDIVFEMFLLLHNSLVRIMCVCVQLLSESAYLDLFVSTLLFNDTYEKVIRLRNLRLSNVLQ